MSVRSDIYTTTTREQIHIASYKQLSLTKIVRIEGAIIRRSLSLHLRFFVNG